MTSKKRNDRIFTEAALRVVEHLKEQGKTFTSEQEESNVQGLVGLASIKVPTDTPIQDLLVTIDIVRDALIARDKDEGFEAITVLLLQWMDTFDHSELAFKMMPLLGGIKDSILAGHFEEAQEAVDGLLVLLRKLHDSTDREIRGRA